MWACLNKKIRMSNVCEDSMSQLCGQGVPQVPVWGGGGKGCNQKEATGCGWVGGWVEHKAQCPLQGVTSW